MLRYTLASLRSRLLRAALTAIAIVLGTAMISGSFVLKNQIENAFDTIFYAAEAKNDVVVHLKTLAFGFDPPFDQQIAEKLKSVPGIAAISPKIDTLGQIVVKGKKISSVGGAPPLLLTQQPLAFDVNSYESGQPPKAGEVAVIKQTADTHAINAGDQIQLATESGLKNVRVSGIFKYAGGASLGGATATVANLGDIQRWFPTYTGKINFINVRKTAAVSPTQLRDVIQQKLGPTFEVQTGQERAKQESDAIGSLLGNVFGYGLLGFAAISVLVGIFVIFNTFSIIVAQRIRELAMMRTLGASRGQILRSVLTEAFLIAAVASIAGVILGLFVAKGIGALLDAFGSGLPKAPASLQPIGVALGLLVGILATVTAAFLPALRATRIQPIAALREGATLPTTLFSRYAVIIGSLFGLVGAALTILGATGKRSVLGHLSIMGFGSLLIVVAVLIGSRFAVPLLSRITGAPFAFSTSGRLARGNAMRNPARTAVTASALMIGVALIIFASSLTEAFKKTVNDTLSKSIKSELLLSEDSQGGGDNAVPKGAAKLLAATSGVAVASAVSQDRDAQIGTAAAVIYGVDPTTIGEVYQFEFVAGSADALRSLDERGVILESGQAKTAKATVGSQIKLRSRANRAQTLTVKAIVKDKGLFGDGAIVTQPTAAALTLSNQSRFVLANVAKGANVGNVERAASTELLKQYPTLKLDSQASFKKSFSSQLDQILALFSALLGLAVFVSILGIINTMLLSIFERTREVGMLRAIGTARKQVRRMVLVESIIIGTIGGIIGVVVGLLLGWVLVRALKSEGLVYAVPWFAIIAAPIGAAIVGLLAGIWPAIRASRLNVLNALSYE